VTFCRILSLPKMLPSFVVDDARAAILADLLGCADTTAERWSKRAITDWTHRPTGEPRSANDRVAVEKRRTLLARSAARPWGAQAECGVLA
jgi:hypothetical protein